MPDTKPENFALEATMSEHCEHYKAFLRASRQALRDNPDLAHNLRMTIEFFDSGGGEILAPRLSAERLKELLRDRLERQAKR